MTSTKARAAVYIRRSSESQEEAPAVQLEFAKRKAAELGLTIEGTAADVRQLIDARQNRSGDLFLDDDISGSVMDRPGLSAMLAAFRSPDCPYAALIAFRRDRLARPDDPIRGIEINRTIHAAGASLVFNDKMVPPPADADQRTASDILSYLEYYAGNKELTANAQRTLSAQISVARRGAWTGGRAPYGFKRVLVGPDGGIVRDLADGEIVRQPGHYVSIGVGDAEKLTIWRWILQRRLAGDGFKRIALALNDRGVPSPDAGRKRRDGGIRHEVSGKWNHTTVKNLCRNRAILGEIEFGRYSEGKFNRFGGDGQEIRTTTPDDMSEFTGRAKRIENDPSTTVIAPAAAEPQFDAEKWKSVQAVVDGRSRSQLGVRRSKDPATYPLAGRVVDLTEGCGHPMYGKVRQRQQDRQKVKVREYCCGAFMQHGKASGCYSNSVDAEKLLRAVLGVLTQQVEHLGAGDKLRRRLAERLGTRIATADRSIELDAARQRLAELESEAKQVAANLARESDEELRQLIRQDWESVKERKAQAEASLTALSRTENQDLDTLIEQAVRQVGDLRSLSADDESHRRSP